jgi:hypothetical protein
VFSSFRKFTQNSFRRSPQSSARLFATNRTQ